MLYRFETKTAVFGVVVENNKVVRCAPYSKSYVGENIQSVINRFRYAKVTIVN